MPITGEHVTLRAIEPEDLEQLRAWRNQPEFRRFFREHQEISKPMQKRWYEAVVLGDDKTRMFAIETKGSKRLLGACGICWIDWRNRSGDFSIYLGADEMYVDDVFTPDAGRLLLKFAFGELGLHRVWAEIYSTDAPKQKLLPRLGFTKEGEHRQTTLVDGAWVNSLFYGILAEEFGRPKTAAKGGTFGGR
jgi:RimJ/RimL family protein N-acetyltransferase